jgi:ankyrin repeat protein
MFGRATVAEILLRSGVDPAARDNRNWTGLHWAAFYRHLETVDVFLEWNAPLELENEFGGTVLDQTVWAAAHSDEPDQFAPVIERLCAAGARTQPVRYPTGMPVIDEILRRHGARAP